MSNAFNKIVEMYCNVFCYYLGQQDRTKQDTGDTKQGQPWLLVAHRGAYPVDLG
jgi:hypothetical protein